MTPPEAAAVRKARASAAPQQIGPRRPAPAPARPRHLRVVRDRPAPGRRPPASTMIVAGLATAVALFGMVTVQSLVGQTQMQTTEIQRRFDAKKDAVEALQVQVANLASLDRVAARAAAMGLVVPPSIVFLPAPGDEDFGAGALPSFEDASGAQADASPSPAASAASAPRGPARPGASTSPGPKTGPGGR